MKIEKKAIEENKIGFYYHIGSIISRRLLFIHVFCLFVGLHSISCAEDMTGMQIMCAFEQRHSARSEIILQTMYLGSGDDIFETRTAQIYNLKDPQGLDQALIVFKGPVDIRGTALLTRETTTETDDQWIYSPSRRQITRVAQGSKRNYFMGTDFSYEDLESENLEDYLYKRLADAHHASGPCFVIEATPVDTELQKQSAYSRRTLQVRKDIFYPVEIHFFDHHNRHVKVLTNQDLYQTVSGSWRPRTITMINLQRNHSTKIKIDRNDIDVDINPMVFTERYLISERHLD
jgi:hypothetical protein